MPAVLPLAGAPPSGGRIGRGTRNRPSCALPVLGATVVVAFALHLLVDLLGRAGSADLAGLVSVAMGMVAVSVVLVPFMLLFVARARAAWTGSAGDQRPGDRSARARVI